MKRYRIYARDGWCCRICGTPYQGNRHRDTQIHHLFPLTEGEKLGLTRSQLDDQRNLLTTCEKCHKLTFDKQARARDFDLIYKLERLEQAKKEIGYYDWLEEVGLKGHPPAREG